MCMSHSRRDRRPISCLHSTVGVWAPARLRLVARCALVRNSLQTKCGVGGGGGGDGGGADDADGDAIKI